MKKRILFYFFIGGSDGGSDYSLFIHLQNLNLEKFEPIIIYKGESGLINKLENKGLKCIVFAGENTKSTTKKTQKNNNKIKSNRNPLRKVLSSIKLFINSLPEAIKLIKIINKYDIDILHLNHNLSGDRAGIIAGIITRKRIISHHRGLYKPVLIDKILSKFIYKIICISDFVKEEYIQNGIKENKCLTIYNGVDTEIFKPIEKRDKNIIIGCIGRLEEWKGQQVLLKAIPTILKEYPFAQFHFIGDGSNKENLVLLAKELKITNAVKFIGSVSNIENYIREFTIAVHTSIEPEPFGRVIIEAMAMGKSVIATDIGGPKEIITNNVDGFLISPNNSEELSHLILRLLKNKNLIETIGMKAREKIINHFNSRTTSNIIQKLYN